MRRRTRRRTWFGEARAWLGVMLGICCLGGLKVMAQASNRATVGTRFEVKAATFATNLGGDRAGIELEIAGWMAEYCRTHLSFLEWRALPSTPSGDDPPWVLKATMAAEGSSPIPAVVLLFERSVSGAVQPLSIREALYPANDLGQPTQAPSRLREDLRLKLGQILGNEQVVERLQMQFLRGIAVARRLQADPDSQRFLIPATWAEMLPGEGSILRAEYRARRSGNTLIPVRVKMTPSEEWSGAIGCRVREFHFPPVDLDQPGWHPDISHSLSNAVPDSILVFMDRYVKDYTFGTTTNGLVIQPFSPATGGGGM
ncbi:MAG: hypothetical protein JNK85_15340 [Verrucomicrobiales bacterium]|nr:hypothetical protein [Verrucomicrobiales bacterium]